MEFGRISDIGHVDFSLPPDDVLTEELWTDIRPGDGYSTEMYVGCAVWGRKDWVGKIYPKSAKDKDFLSHYVKQFNCIELNSLFYSLQPLPVIEKWASLAGPGFRFCPKFSNTISHVQQLKNVDRETGLFIDTLRGFGAKLGHSFLQLSEGFGPDRAAVLQDYLRKLPRDLSTCVELRHADWFLPGSRIGETAAVKNTWRLMRELGIGTVITDSSGRRDCLHMRLTAPVAFIRFVANNLHPTDFTRIDAWAGRIKTWMDKGLPTVYFIVHNKEEINTPDLCKYAVERFNKVCGQQLQAPSLLNQERPGLTLFG